MQLTALLILATWLVDIATIASPVSGSTYPINPSVDVPYSRSTQAATSNNAYPLKPEDSTVHNDVTSITGSSLEITDSGHLENVSPVCEISCNIFGLILLCTESPASCYCDPLGIVICAIPSDACQQNCLCQCSDFKGVVDAHASVNKVEASASVDEKKPESPPAADATQAKDIINTEDVEVKDFDSDCHVHCNVFAVFWRCQQSPTYCRCDERGWVRCRVHSKFCEENCICRCESKRVAITASDARVSGLLEATESGTAKMSTGEDEDRKSDTIMHDG
ncbi:hypothetical protein ACHAQA_004328 [Verticillium albo-atrum]